MLFVLILLSQFCYAQNKGLPITAVETGNPNEIATIVDRTSIEADSFWVYILNKNPGTSNNTEYFEYKDGQILKGIHSIGEQKKPYSEQELKNITPTVLEYVQKGKNQFKGQLLYVAADFGKLDDVKILHALGMEEPFRYRNKAQFPIQKVDGSPVIGFYKKKSHDIIPTDQCIIQHDVNDKIIKTNAVHQPFTLPGKPAVLFNASQTVCDKFML